MPIRHTAARGSRHAAAIARTIWLPVTSAATKAGIDSSAKMGAVESTPVPITLTCASESPA